MSSIIYSTQNQTTLPQYDNLIYVKNSLFIETYIVGYKKEGESILFFIRADDTIFFSGLVDCYRTNNIDKVSEILEKNQIHELCFICWTHPDSDHSLGMKQIIDKFASAETSIWIPEGVDVKEIKCGKKVKILFDNLRKKVANTNYHVYSASDEKNLLFYKSICFQKDMNKYPLKLKSYAPNSHINKKTNVHG